MPEAAITPNSRIQTPPITGTGILRISSANLPIKDRQIRHDGRAADDPDTVDPGDRHNANIFSVSGVRRSAEEAGKHVRTAVGKQGAAQARIFDKIAVDYVTGNYQMADMLSQYDQRRRRNDKDSVDIESRLIKMRQLEPRRRSHGCQIDQPHKERKGIAADNAEQDRDDRHKTLKCDRAEDRYR